LLALAGKVLGNDSDTRTAKPRRDVLPFDARHRFMVTRNKTEQGDRIYAKGAPEAIAGLPASR